MRISIKFCSEKEVGRKKGWERKERKGKETRPNDLTRKKVKLVKQEYYCSIDCGTRSGWSGRSYLK